MLPDAGPARRQHSRVQNPRNKVHLKLCSSQADGVCLKFLKAAEDLKYKLAINFVAQSWHCKGMTTFLLYLSESLAGGLRLRKSLLESNRSQF